MIRADATLDAGGFLLGLKTMDSGVLRLVNTCRSFTTILPGLSAIIGAVAAFKATIDLGGNLTDLSLQTGQSVADLMILQQAFKNAGLSADQVRPLLQKFQANLADATEKGGDAESALSKLGLTAGALRSGSALEQFEKIQEGLRGVTDQAERAQVLRDLFGKRGGGQLLSVLGDPEAFASARRQLGGLPGLIQQMAPAFDAIGDAIGAFTIKFQQFTAGALSYVGPALADIFTTLSEIDFTGLGEGVGLVLQLGSVLLMVLKPVLQMIGAISTGIHNLLANLGVLPAVVAAAKVPGIGDLGIGAGSEAPVSHLASLGGAFAGPNLGTDLPGRIDRTNSLLEGIYGAVSRDKPAAPRDRPDVPV